MSTPVRCRVRLVLAVQGTRVGLRRSAHPTRAGVLSRSQKHHLGFQSPPLPALSVWPYRSVKSGNEVFLKGQYVELGIHSVGSFGTRCVGLPVAAALVTVNSPVSGCWALRGRCCAYDAARCRRAPLTASTAARTRGREAKDLLRTITTTASMSAALRCTGGGCAPGAREIFTAFFFVGQGDTFACVDTRR